MPGTVFLMASGDQATSPPPQAPVNTVAPVISGTATTGQTLSVNTGAWSNNPTTFAYQWRRNGTAIAGATTASYVLITNDEGQSITATISASNAAGTGTAASNAVVPTAANTPPANLTAPAISGVVQTGQTLTVSNGTWSGSPVPTFTYQWKRDGVNISGATGSSYVLQVADQGTAVLATVTATNTAGSASANSNTVNPAAPVPPTNTAAPVLSGTAQTGRSLTVTNGTWTGAPTGFTYQWKRANVNIAGATSASYVLVAADENQSIKATVTATNAAGSASADSNSVTSVPPPPPPTGGFLMISAAKLATRPSSGAAYNGLKASADSAVSLTANLTGSTTPSATTPWLTNYNDTGTTRIWARIQAAGALYAFQGGETYRAAVEKAVRYGIGSETASSTDGKTASGDYLLATMRVLPALITAADFIGLPMTTTGSRSGWTTKQYGTWLGEVLTKTIGGNGRWNQIKFTSGNTGNNWGGHARNSHVCIAAATNNTAELDLAAKRLRLWLGDRRMLASPNNLTQFQITADHDTSFRYIEPGQTDWVNVNNASQAGQPTKDRKDGLLVEDVSRSGVSYSATGAYYDVRPGVSYMAEVLSPSLMAAVVLGRKGYDVWNWGSNTTETFPAFRRIADWFNREGLLPNFASYESEKHISWVLRHFLNVNYPTVAAGSELRGRCWGNTSWYFNEQGDA